MYNFESDSHCARIDVKPFLLPKKFTVCFKVNNEFTKTFQFLSLLSTKSGESLVGGFKNKTFNEMRQEIIPLLAAAYNQGWSSVWHDVGNKWTTSTGGLGLSFGWQKWEQRCVGFDFDVGKVTHYIDGLDDGSQIRGNEFFSDALKWANDQLKEKNLVTDVLIGCSHGAMGMSFGQITDIQMFDRILTPEEMKAMTTCDGKKLVGNLINSNIDNSTTYGSWAEEVRVHPEEFCPQKNFSGLFFDQWHWSSLEAIDLCKKLNRKLFAVMSEEDFENLVYYFTVVTTWGGWLMTPIHKDSNGSWVHVETGEKSILPWAPNEPLDVARFIYARINMDHPVHLISGGITWTHMTFCVSEDPKDYRFVINILGLCSATTFDTQYVFIREDQYTYLGKWGSTLKYKGDGIWSLKNKEEAWTGKQLEAKIATSHKSLALGTFDVSFDGDTCTKGMEDKTIKITITHCEEDQFTCFSGDCVSFNRRCNRIVDCPDSSDEKECAILQIDKTTYIKEYPPIQVDSNYQAIKVPVNISIDIWKILYIDEIEGIFGLSFGLHTTWLDKRLVYKNLKQSSNLNTLTEKEKEDIWTPAIVFSNTEKQDSVIKDERVIAKINRLGEGVMGEADEAIKTSYYKGEDNSITFSRIYDIKFLCSYNMAWYPFDLQRCHLLLKPFGNTGEYIDLINKDIKYFDEMDLSKYYIKQWKYQPKETNNGLGVEASIYLGRRLLSILTTVYIPSILLNIIGHITNYFKPFYFESAIAVNLTVMLVLTSMFISVVAGLPVTSYIKMIDIWLLFNLIIPFVDVLLCCVIDNLRTDLEDERQINHHGKVRTVTDSGNADKEEPDTHSTPVQSISQDLQGYNYDLVHINEKKQDDARKEFYLKNTTESAQKRKILTRCINFSRRIKPVIAFIFVVVYWFQGLKNYNRIE